MVNQACRTRAICIEASTAMRYSFRLVHEFVERTRNDHCYQSIQRLHQVNELFDRYRHKPVPASAAKLKISMSCGLGKLEILKPKRLLSSHFLIWSKFTQELGFQSRRIRTWSVYVTRFAFQHKQHSDRATDRSIWYSVSWRCRTSINHIPANKIKNTLIIFCGVYRRGRIVTGSIVPNGTINQIAFLKWFG